jgi:hypothetical protein
MILRSLIAPLGVLLLAGGAEAASYSLADLANGQTFTSDDGSLTFSNFDVTRTKNLSSDLTMYTVTTTSSGFMLTSNEFDAGTGGLRKLDLSYTVTSSSPIVEAGLAMDGSRQSGKIKVEKDIEAQGSDEGTFLVTVLSGNHSVLSDSDQFSPGATSFDVEEQIRIKKVASLDSVTNSFRDAAHAVPEPGTMALFAFGAAGLALIGRRRPQ